MRSKAISVVILAIAFTAAGLASGTAASAQTIPPARVLVYGDSLSWEARFELETAIEAQLPGWDAIVRTSPGIAACDLLPAMVADRNLNAGVVVLQFVGVPLSRCMQGRDAVAAAQADLDTAVGIWAGRGVPVVIVGAPRQIDLPRDLDTVGVINRDTATRTGQPFVDSGVLLRNPWTGIYQHQLPCLADEGPDQGCGPDGTIATRDLGTGTHFCPVSNADGCPAYSSGVVRYSVAIAAAAARAAGTTPTPLPSVPDPSGIRDIASALWTGVGATTSTSGSARSQSIADAAVLPAELVPPDLPPRGEAPSAVPADPLTAPAALAALDERECRPIRQAVATLDGAARSDVTFAAVDDSASVTQIVRVLPTLDRARDTFRAYRGRNADQCLSKVLGGLVTVERITGVGDDALTYRVSGARELVINAVLSGRAVTVLTFANAAAPPPPASVVAITQSAVDRLDTALLTDPGR